MADAAADDDEDHEEGDVVVGSWKSFPTPPSAEAHVLTHSR